jgi:hypothetical protein
MTWQVTVEAFAGDPWPGQDVVDELRIADKIHVKRPGPEKRVVVAEAAVEKPGVIRRSLMSEHGPF